MLGIMGLFRKDSKVLKFLLALARMSSKLVSSTMIQNIVRLTLNGKLSIITNKEWTIVGYMALVFVQGQAGK